MRVLAIVLVGGVLMTAALIGVGAAIGAPPGDLRTDEAREKEICAEAARIDGSHRVFRLESVKGDGRRRSSRSAPLGEGPAT